MPAGVDARAPAVLPKGLHSSALVAHLCERHYLHGFPQGV